MRTAWMNPQPGDTPFQAGLRKFCKRKGLTQKALASSGVTQKPKTKETKKEPKKGIISSLVMLFSAKR